MAETLTYDPTPADNPELSPEEQDSLQVGEKLAEQEQELLAGKFQNAEELEKAYVELQKKFGEKGSEDSETTSGSDDSDEGKETSEETEETTEDSPALSLIKEASTEYYDNDGEIKPETLERFNEMSSQDLVSAYLQAQKESTQQPQQQQQEIEVSDNDINSIKNSVGGENEYSKIVQWAGDNLDSTAISAFDQLVSTGNVPAIKLAIAGLKSQYENTNGYEGRMLTGKAAKAGDNFRSQAELVKAMGDPRYDNDPAYRQDVIDKLERSDNLQF
jgi:hypothetical protein